MGVHIPYPMQTSFPHLGHGRYLPARLLTPGERALAAERLANGE